MAIKIAGDIEKSFYESTKLTKKELAAIAKAASTASLAFSKGLKDAAPTFNAIENAGKAAFKAVATGAAAAATAVGAVTAASVSVGSSFEEQMSTVKAISNATESEFEKLNNLAEELGASTQFTATEVGQAMEYMAMAGWKTNDMLQGMEGVLNLAASSGEDLATTSDIVTDAMTAFGMKADEVEHFSDVLAAAATNSNTNVSMMGETFQYAASLAGAMNYSVEDTAIAIGLMANSGIKASNAGTALRKIFSETTNGATVSGKALGQYTIQTQNADGSMRDLKSVIEDMRTAFSQMTDSEKAANAEAIAGKTAMSGLLAIVNASEADYQKLAGAIYNCQGAAEKMADTRLDNLKGDATIAKSAMEGLGIQIYEEINEPMREGVQAYTELIGKISSGLSQSDFLSDISKQIPTVVRETKELGQSISEFAEPFLAVGGWLVDNPGLLVGTITGIGSALSVYKVANGIMPMTSALSALGPVGIGILAIGGVAGVIVGIGTAVKKSAEEAKKANLAEHFGDIALSLSDLNEVADFIIYTDNLGKVREALEQFEGLDTVQKSINDSMKAINKMNWKVSIGMELSETEIDDYKGNIENYVQQCQQYVTDQQYAMTMAVGVLTDDDLEGQNIVNQLNQFYADKQGELAQLGTDLNNAITDAFQDGLLDIDEAARISEIQSQMAEVQAQLAGGNFEASLEVLSAKYGGNLDAASFQNLQAELADKVEEARTAYEESYQSAVSGELAMMEDGSISKSEYDSNVAEFRKKYLEQVGELQNRANEFQINTIYEQYGDELYAAEEKMQDIQDRVLKYADQAYNAEGMGSTADRLGAIQQYAKDEIKKEDILPEDTMAAISELREQAMPAIEQMNETMQELRDNNQAIPEELQETMNKITKIGAVTEDTASIWQMVSDTLLKNEDYEKLLTTAYENGEHLPEEFSNGIMDNQAALREAANKTWLNAVEYAEGEFKKGIDISTDVRIKMNAQYSGMSGFNATMPQNLIGSTFVPHAKGGIFDTPHYGVLAEEGREAYIPIDGSQNAIDLWQQTGELLGMKYRNTGDSISALSRQINSSSYTTDNSSNIEYKPQINFYGDAPSRDDLDSAMITAQERFNELMKQYIKDHGRFSLK